MITEIHFYADITLVCLSVSETCISTFPIKTYYPCCDTFLLIFAGCLAEPVVLVPVDSLYLVVICNR